MYRTIFVDLEMNPTGRRTLKNEVIEIGAVKLDENKNEVESFHCYVRPEVNAQVEQHITELTGITTDMVANADTFNTVFKAFVGWCEKDDCEYWVLSWSDSDRVQLEKERLYKRDDFTIDYLRASYVLSHWDDLQKTFDEYMFYTKQTKLTTAMFNAGVEFPGRAHNALDDARAISLLYTELTKAKGSQLKKIHNTLKEAKKPLTTSLGEMMSCLNL